MYELGILLLVVVVAMLVTTAAIAVVGPAVRILEYVLLGGSVVTILGVTFFVGAEVVMRYVFIAPIPGHREGSERSGCGRAIENSARRGGGRWLANRPSPSDSWRSGRATRRSRCHHNRGVGCYTAVAS